ESPVRGVRLNCKKGDPNGLSQRLWDNPIPYVKNGYYVNYDKIGNHPYHHAGALYVQEPGAMMPAAMADIPENGVVLDLCAAPGGKSGQLYSRLGEKGILVANEIIPARCKILTSNIERLGYQNTVVTCMDSARIAKVFPKTFDVIMVDAPCSGEGMFRKEEIAITEWSMENVATCAARQEEILNNAVKALKDGGTIFYATCTFSLEENEKQVDRFLSRHPEFELVAPCEEVLNHTVDGICFEGCEHDNLHLCRRFYPYKEKGEGQFGAVLRSTLPPSPTVPPKKKKTQNDKVPSVVTDFLDEVLVRYNSNKVIMRNGTPTYFTPDFSVEGATVFACGVTIGELKKNYILPHHQFFSAMGKQFKRKIKLPPDHPLLKKYLKGEEISADCENGWAVVTVDGYPIGGVKVVNGIAKNHYPKGLRLR
ncbi:MAG: methyltransferase domain-containing protein, partial [Clostridia bacterium]|nr:methyltransferase domain-containing protein [Clostridia bacterium]